jgi:hypothetical protein
VVILVICFGQFFESLRINAVLDVRTIDAKKDDLPTGVDSPPKAAAAFNMPRLLSIPELRMSSALRSRLESFCLGVRNPAEK